MRLWTIHPQYLDAKGLVAWLLMHGHARDEQVAQAGKRPQAVGFGGLVV